MSDVAETWWDAGGILAIHTAAFVHVLVLLAAGFALCFGESINLT